VLIWKDLGLVFEVNGNPLKPLWHVSHAQAPNAVTFENFVRVYFTGRPHGDSQGNFLSRAMFVDFDPENNFEILRVSQNPILELGDPGFFDEHGTYPFSVLKKDNSYTAVYGGWSRSASIPFDISLGLAKSQNGESFERIGDGPILSPILNEPFVITSPKIRFFNDSYHLTYTAGVKWFNHQGRMEIIYKIRSAVSSDLINWQRSGKNLIQDFLGEDEAQACGDIIETASGFHMFFCYRGSTDFRFNSSQSYKIGYAHSLDLETWCRDDRYAGILSTKGSWDETMCAYPNVFQFKGKTYILYLGNGTGIAGFGAKVLIGDL
jgi:predicted GH43/DUF377 family glycosyl hydrolase